jgi:carboxymethylenebutenolidase
LFNKNIIMKKTGFLLLLVQLFMVGSQAQTCCHQPGDFPTLAMAADFQEAHLDPLPLNYQPKEYSSMIKFATEDGRQGSAFYVPSDKPSTAALIIFHEWWGLNDYIKQEAERWQKLLGNIDVYAIDLYDGQVATEAKDAGKLSNALDEQRAEKIIKGLLAEIGRDKQIATLGWCMGGSWSFKATLLAGDRSEACVMYYGFPETNEEKIKQLKTDVMYVWAMKDKFITKDAVDHFEQQVLATQNKFERHDINADHAFANPSNPKFAAKEAVAAEQFAIAFLKKRLLLQP